MGFKDLLAPSLFKQVKLVRKLGNYAVLTALKVEDTGSQVPGANELPLL